MRPNPTDNPLNTPEVRAGAVGGEVTTLKILKLSGNMITIPIDEVEPTEQECATAMADAEDRRIARNAAIRELCGTSAAARRDGGVQ